MQYKQQVISLKLNHTIQKNIILRWSLIKHLKHFFDKIQLVASTLVGSKWKLESAYWLQLLLQP